ncbi:hypothetical protein F5884DRAFT_289614 [Xylogone sp. PMI_703]|nr:hypothetical protein F5884DRAFT_289614 [Xylogone sp. PMI_703]
MSKPLPNAQHIIYAYRHLYKALLHAVQYSKPARYVGRDKLRHAFRKDNLSNFDPVKIERTIEFLQIAARERGLEHRIVKNLLHTAYWKSHSTKTPAVKPTVASLEVRRTAKAHYNMTLAMLNNTMGLCLR